MAARVVSLRRPVRREMIVASEKRPVRFRNVVFSVDNDYEPVIFVFLNFEQRRNDCLHTNRRPRE